MFQFSSFALHSYVFTMQWPDVTRAGFSHSEISVSKVVCASTKLIAAYHVLHRLSVPRNPPYALSNLIELFLFDLMYPKTKTVRLLGRHTPMLSIRIVGKHSELTGLRFNIISLFQIRTNISPKDQTPIRTYSRKKTKSSISILLIHPYLPTRGVLVNGRAENTLWIDVMSLDSWKRIFSFQRSLLRRFERRGETIRQKLLYLFLSSNACGRCASQWTPLHPETILRKKWRWPDSNRWPLTCKASALPTELHPHGVCLTSVGAL